jgi:predicted RNase H-like HicB family nuclease
MNDMTADQRKPLADYLALEYPFHVLADPDGGYVIVFPDLPGCMTQVDSIDEVGPMAEDVRLGWIETEYERGREIPPPSYPAEHSGKFNVRLPRSLHRSLAEEAEREGISLNQYVVALLARRDAQAQVQRRLDQLEDHLGDLQQAMREQAARLAPGAR